MKKRIILWLIGSLIGSVIYALIFKNRIVSTPDFIVSTNDLLVYMVVFFLISLVFSLPVLFFLLFRKLWSGNQKMFRFYRLNSIFIVGCVIYLSLLQFFVVKNYQDTLDLAISYGLSFWLITNILILTKPN